MCLRHSKRTNCRYVSLRLANRCSILVEVGFNNPSWTWSELEATLSDRKGRDGRSPGSLSWNAGGDSPAWGRKRQPFEAPESLRITRVPGTVPYAELHTHSNYSFLDGASHPEELATEAARLGLEALALTDHNGFYGVVRFAEAARAVGLPTVFGAEITLASGLADDCHVARTEGDTMFQVDTRKVPDSHAPDPDGRHLLVLADGPAGYARLARALSLGHLAGEKGAPQFTFGDVADVVSGVSWVLTGCRKGAVPRALFDHGPSAARRELEKLVSAFGRDRVLVELWDHGDPIDSARNDALVEIAHRVGVESVATNNVHYATPTQRKLAAAIAAVRARCSLDEIDPAVLAKLETQVLRQSIDQVWAECSRFFAERDPTQLQRAAADPRHKMALVFRWYLGMSSRWAIGGDESRKMDCQIWCGPCIGSFNDWTANTFLADPANRGVVVVGANLMAGAAAISRARLLLQSGIDPGPAALTWTPRPLGAPAVPRQPSREAHAHQ